MIRRPPVPLRRRLLILAPVLAVAAAGGGAAAVSGAPQAIAPPEVRRVFAAAGGRIVARVTVTGERRCPVEMIDRAGTLLAEGVAGPAPLTLESRATPGDRVAVVLRPSVRRGFSWQVTATGLEQPGDGLTTG